ncbi:MAG: addiction module antidote protein, HigA family [uncultured bacterium]|nr:MAG: addiction module antidote protein, HigA family [uncultured bacterium]OGT66993.1 MAG: addiction module antidote protein, HigA family [Gammaproteobacteria bacterium RIFCSPLOWO2_02_FULL_38_11]HLD73556.1 HigA family addiction module antitoxin [Bdellovibrionota bacterium]
MIKKPLHPGELVREVCIEATGLTVTEVAKKLDVDRTTLSRLLNGSTGISPEMALRLSIALGSSPTLWLNVQRDYDLWLAEKFRSKLHVEKIKNAA